jgi:DNA-binding transcriptional MerR regulator
MLYGYHTYNNYSQIGYAQPHADPYFVSPDSLTSQLGLNQEQIRELLEEQERWDREFQQELEEEERARVSAQHQEQEQHQDEVRWAPTPPISDSEPTPQAYEVLDEPPQKRHVTV